MSKRNKNYSPPQKKKNYSYYSLTFKNIRFAHYYVSLFAFPYIIWFSYYNNILSKIENDRVISFES